MANVPSFKQFTSETLNELNYKDIWGKQFVEFREKYSEIPENIKKNLYVHFGNFAGSTLEKTPYAGKDIGHEDPVGVYAYPLDYVINHPADIQYGFGSKYLRVIKQVCSEDKVLNLQTITKEEVEKILEKILSDKEKVELNFVLDSSAEDEDERNLYTGVNEAIKNMHGDAARGIDHPGGILFNAITHKFINSGGGFTRYKYRTNKEQTDILLKAGYLMVKDLEPKEGNKQRYQAIIHHFEPEQVVFLRRDAFKIVDVYQLRTKEIKSGLLPDPLLLTDPLAKRIASYLGTSVKSIARYISSSDEYETDEGKKFVTGKAHLYWLDKPIKFYIGFSNRVNHAHRGSKENTDEKMFIDLIDFSQKEEKHLKVLYNPDLTFNEIFNDFSKKLDEFYKKEKPVEEVLDEGQQDYINFLGKYAQDDYAKSSLEWAKKTLKKQDRIMWFLRFVKLYLIRKEDPELYKAEIEKLKKNPAKDYFTTDEGAIVYNKKNFERNPLGYIQDMKAGLEHYIGQADQIPKMNNMVFKFQTPLDLFHQLLDIETEYKEKVDDDKRLIPLEDKDELIIKFPDGFAWVDIGRSYCPDEAKAMGHCGNVEGRHRTDDQILSLNKIVKKGDKTYRIPHLTFILGGDGRLGEMKGRSNEKPAEKYHPYIIKLLKDRKLIHGIKPNAGYLPSHNFKLSDLESDERQEVVKENPTVANFEDLVNLKGYNNSEVQEKARKILNHHDIQPWDDKSNYFMVSGGNRSFSDFKSDFAMPDKLENLIDEIDNDDIDESDLIGYVEKLIEGLPSSTEEKLAQYYKISEKDFDTREEFVQELVELILDDDGLDIKDLVTNNSKIFSEYKKVAKTKAIEWTSKLVPSYYISSSEDSGYDDDFFYPELVYIDSNHQVQGISYSVDEMSKAYDADWYIALNLSEREIVDVAMAMEGGGILTELENDYHDVKEDDIEIPEYDISDINKEFNKVILRHLGVGRVEHPKQQELDLSQFNLAGFKDYLIEPNYKEKVAEKVSKLLKRRNREK